MICSGCGVELEARYRFCPWCGAAQPGGGGDGADGGLPDARDAELRRLRAAVNWMTAELGRLSQWLADLESGGTGSGSALAPEPPADPGTDPASTPPQDCHSRRPRTGDGRTPAPASRRYAVPSRGRRPGCWRRPPLARRPFPRLELGMVVGGQLAGPHRGGGFDYRRRVFYQLGD